MLQRSGLVRPKRKLTARHRKKRPRRPLPGMMLFQDGSTHEWLAGQPPLDLIVTLDDATAEIYSIFLVEQEDGVLFPGPGRDGRQGRAVLVLLHRSGQSLLPHAQGRGEVSKDTATQVGRALAELGDQAHPPTAPRPGAAHGAGLETPARTTASAPAPRADPRPSRRPTASWPKSIWRSTTPTSPSPPPRKARLSPPSSATSPACSAPSTSARSATTTACASASSICRSPSSATEGTTCGSPFRCAITPTAPWPSFTVLAGSPTTPPKEP